jgi:ABC-type transport system involved in multi-copper enzyme maturation permease subunit
MTWLVWRQHRNQAYLAAAALAAFAVLLLVTGRQIAGQYQSALAACTPSHACGNLANTLILGTPLLSLLVTLTVVVPCVLGVFWGGPLVARELETGTNQFAWMQSVSRHRWLTAKVGWVLLAAAVWAGAVSALVTWWSSPVNALKSQNFQPGQFDIQGIVPIGYALFAVALGIAAGTLLRRALPAMAITLVVFTFLRLVIGQDLRSRYLTAVTKTFSFLQFPAHRPALPTGSYWLVSQGLVGPRGQVPASQAHGPSISAGFDGLSVSLNNMPSACQRLALAGDPRGIFPCLTAHGYRGLFITYQPATRYWAFQGIETGIFVLLAAVLIIVTAIVVLRRDA